MTDFAENLKDLIIEKGLSLRKIGKEIGISSGQFSDYLHGTYPTVERAVELANYFDCSVDYLFGLTEQRNYDNYTGRGFDLELFIARYLQLLQINNITHWKFAKQSGLAESTLRHWRAGHKPLMASIQIIATKLNGSIDYLVGRIDKN